MKYVPPGTPSVGVTRKAEFVVMLLVLPYRAPTPGEHDRIIGLEHLDNGRRACEPYDDGNPLEAFLARSTSRLCAGCDREFTPRRRNQRHCRGR